MYSDNRKISGIFYGYVVAAGTFFVQLLSMGLYNTFGIFFVQLSSEFEWTRAVISGPRALNSIIFGLSSILTGRLSDRFSPRLVLTIFFVLFSLGYVLMSQISGIWQFYLFYGVLLGIGMGGTMVPVLSILARWFAEKRGMMTGIAKIGAGIGIFSMPLAARWLISDYGWRNAYLILGLASLVILILVAQFFRRDPSQIRQLPDEGTVPVKENQI